MEWSEEGTSANSSEVQENVGLNLIRIFYVHANQWAHNYLNTFGDGATLKNFYPYISVSNSVVAKLKTKG